MERCVIVASGPSAMGFVPPYDVCVIAVNGAIEWIGRADYFFTLDLSPENVWRLKNKREGVVYAVASGYDVVDSPLNSYIDWFLYRLSERGPEPREKGSPEWWFWRWSCVPGLSEDPGVVHTGNSAYGALGLAYHLGFKDVALVGVDGTQEEKVEGGFCNSLSHLPMLFKSAEQQIDFTSCGKLDAGKRMSFERWYNGC